MWACMHIVWSSSLARWAGFVLLMQALAILRGVRRGNERALAASASGAVMRSLHLGALWNAASFPNALIAQLCVIPFAVVQPTQWQAAQLWMLPLALITTKLLEAQAFKVLAASAGLTDAMWRLILSTADRHAQAAARRIEDDRRIEEDRRTAEAAAATSATGSAAAREDRGARGRDDLTT